MQRSLLVLFVIVIMGVLLWNMYLTSQLKNAAEEKEEFNFKIEMLEGELNIMEYDLITAEDSLRIFYKMARDSNHFHINDELYAN